MNEFLSSSNSVNHSSYLRILALGCLDIFVTLPIGILGLVIDVKQNMIVFYTGWTVLHTEWEPLGITKEMWGSTPFGTFDVKWNEWVNVFFALIYFALFGLTAEARAKYRRTFRLFLRPTGLKLTTTESELSTVNFGTQHVANEAVSLSLGYVYFYNI